MTPFIKVMYNKKSLVPGFSAGIETYYIKRNGFPRPEIWSENFL